MDLVLYVFIYVDVSVQGSGMLGQVNVTGGDSGRVVWLSAQHCVATFDTAAIRLSGIYQAPGFSGSLESRKLGVESWELGI